MVNRLKSRLLGSMKQKIKVAVEAHGVRIDHFLASALSELSRNQIQQLIRQAKVTNNGSPVKKSYLLESGDVIEVELPQEASPSIESQAIPLDILYQDDQIAIVNKPRAMVVHPAPGHQQDTLVNALLHHLDRLSNTDESRPGIVHRMDKDTTGLLIVTKDETTHHYFLDLFKRHDLTRVYWALVHGRVKFDQLTIDAPLGRSSHNRKLFTIDEAGRRAVTHVKVLETFDDYSLVECRLETGRTHQIRVHLKSINHPVVGDGAYGPKKSPWAKHGQFLHAKQLSFVHPNGQIMSFDSELPDDFQGQLNRLRRVKQSREIVTQGLPKDEEV